MGSFGAMQAGVVLLLLIIIGGGITLFVLFQLTLQRTMDAVSPKNRQMSGGSVWLNLIPLFNLVFPFVFNNALKNAIEMEYFDRKITKPVNLSTGTVVYPLMNLLSLFFSLLFYSTYDTTFSMLSGLAVITNIITQIVFWTQVAGHKRILLGGNNEQQFQQVIQSVPTVKYCSNCKNPMPVNDNFCLICGYDSRQQQASSIPAQPVHEDPITPLSFDNQISSKPNSIPETKVDKLSKYYDMLQQGLITREDFDRIKKELL